MRYFCWEWNAHRKRKAETDGRFLYAPLLVHWLHQSLRYLDRGEMIFRICAESIVLAATFVLLDAVVPGWLLPLVMAGITVHTLFWVFDSTLPAALQFARPDALNPGAEATATYLNRMAARLAQHPSVSGIAVFGSLARREWHRRSDLDVRLLRRSGISNWLGANMLLIRERTIALWAGQPLDAYLADDVDVLRAMRADEPPIFILKRDVRLEQAWPQRPEMTLTVADFQRRQQVETS